MKSIMHLIAALLAVFLSGGASAQQQTRDVWNDSLANLLRNSAALHLPTAPLENKIREGRAKHKSSAQIYMAVKARQKHLLQISTLNNGTVPDDCSRQLIILERKAASPVAHSEKTVVQHKPKTSPRTRADSPKIDKIEKVKTAPEPDTLSPHESAAPSDVSENKNGDKNQQKLEKKLQKSEARTERKLAKAAEKAEKRMNTIQKKLQKKSKRKFGAE